MEGKQMTCDTSPGKHDDIRLSDNDHGMINMTLRDKEIRSWSYASDDERRIKMLVAREYIEGWCDGWKYYSDQESALYLRDLHNRQDVRKMLADFAGMPNTAEVRQLIVDRLNRTKG
jgi:hypothetical protein